MKKLLPALALLALAPACEPPKTVKAQRFSVLFAESGLALTHGGGRMVQEIFIPELKVACMLVFEYRELLGAKGPEPRLYAFAADRPRNDLTGTGNKPSAIEEIEIPLEVAKEIQALAELSARRDRETWRLGQSIASRKLMKELPPEDGPR